GTFPNRDDELWKTEAPFDDAHTTLAEDINSGAGGSYPDSLTNIGGTVFMYATDGSTGYELFKTQAPFDNATLEKNIYPGAGSSHPVDLTDVNGTLFFSANDGTHGYELWQSDGTDAGTQLVRDIDPSGSNSSNPNYLTNVGGTLFFGAYDGAQSSTTHQRELWKTFVPGPPAAGGGAATTPLAALGASSAKVKKGSVSIPITCPAGGEACQGSISLTGNVLLAETSKKKRIGGASFSIPAGQTQKVKVKLSKAAKQTLQAKGKLAANVTITSQGAGGAKTSAGKL